MADEGFAPQLSPFSTSISVPEARSSREPSVAHLSRSEAGDFPVGPLLGGRVSIGARPLVQNRPGRKRPGADIAKLPPECQHKA